MKIRGAVFRDRSGAASIEALDLEAPRADEVLVRVVATGVCHTDLKVAAGGLSPRPIVLGHEGAGIVEAVGAGVAAVKPGDRVVMTYDSCGVCPSCLANRRSYCDEVGPRSFGGLRPDGSSPLAQDGRRVHGSFFGQSSFATHALAYERNVVRVAEDVPLELLGPLGCGVQTGAGAVINALRVGVGRSLAVFGVGAVGLAAVMAAVLVGAERIVAVDLNSRRLELARALGATDVVDAGEGDVQLAVRRLTGRGVDFALDTTGATAVIEAAIAALAPLGACGLVAPPAQPVPVAVRHLMLGGRTLRGIVQGDSVPRVFIPALVAQMRAGRFPLDRLVSFYPFERINDALRDARAGVVVKPVLRMAGETP